MIYKTIFIVKQCNEKQGTVFCFALFLGFFACFLKISNWDWGMDIWE